MKDLLIKKLSSDFKQDPYVLPLKDVDINCPQVINLSQSYMRGNRYYFNIIDSRLDAIDSPCIGIRIPEIKGKGLLRFTDYPGLKLIKSFEINVNGHQILKMNGFDIYSAYFAPNIYRDDTIVGHRSDYCNYKKGNHLDHTIFSAIDLFVPIFTQFERAPPHTILRIPRNNKVEFIVEIGNLTDILSYNREFSEDSLSVIKNIVPDIKMLIRAYNIQSQTKIEDRYIEENNFTHVREDSYQTTKDEFFTNTFKSITEIGWFCKTNQFTKQYFISHPGFDATEKDYINAFRSRILPDIVRIADDDTKFLHLYPEGSKFASVDNNTCYEFDNLNKCKILIRNVPKNCKIWFHTNILEFNRGGRSDSYNISKKFKYILGDYIKEADKIVPIEIIDELTIEDVSIPIDIWTHKYNTAGRDLRSYVSKNDDLLINEPYIYGLDFVTKNIGFEKDTTVKAGPSERIVENTKFNFFMTYFGYYHSRSYYFMDKNRYPCIGSANFNIHNTIVNKPSALESIKEKNILNCSVEVKWREYDENHPLGLIQKALHVFIKRIKKIKYGKDSLEIVE